MSTTLIDPALEAQRQAVRALMQNWRKTSCSLSQSSMGCLRSATVPVSNQGILEVLPIRSDRFVTNPFETYMCRKRGFPAARAGIRPRPTARCLPAHAGRGAAAARKSFRGRARNRSQQHVPTYKPAAKVRWLTRSTESAVGSPRNDRNLASRGCNGAFSGRIDVQTDP